MNTTNGFLSVNTNYDVLLAFQKSECIYDVTYHFTNRFLKNDERTRNQMIQAARSGKQNITEGIEDYRTSKEMGLKLINVARGSLQELLQDYKDYLRVRGLEQWQRDSQKAVQCRSVCARHNDSAFYRERLDARDDTAIANIAITLIFQANKLLYGLIEYLKRDFLENGGIKEEMTRARLNRRNMRG